MYKTLRQRRYNNLIYSGFLPFEAQELSDVRYSEAPYLIKMMKERSRISEAFYKQAIAFKWSKTRREEEYKAVIRQEYIDHKWLRLAETFRIGKTRYKASPWEMLKYYRQKAIDAGEYHPTNRGKRVRRKGESLYIKIYKGDIQAQKKRAAERRERMSEIEREKYKKQRREQKVRAKERAKRKEIDG
jgi:hypothetical protein